jgi:hypothetical protein
MKRLSGTAETVGMDLIPLGILSVATVATIEMPVARLNDTNANCDDTFCQP